MLVIRQFIILIPLLSTEAWFIAENVVVARAATLSRGWLMPVVLLLHMVVPPLLPSVMTDYRLGLMSGQIFVCLAHPLVNFSFNVFKYLLEQPGVHCLRLRLVTVTTRKSVNNSAQAGSFQGFSLLSKAVQI